MKSFAGRKPQKADDIEVTQPFQAKAQYVARKLGTPVNQLTSVLKVCRDFTPAEIDIALSHAADATVRDKTALFFKSLWSMRYIT